jgi:pyruvate kinase
MSLPKSVTLGGKILIDDGLMEVVCTEITDTHITVKVANKAILCERKGVLIPGAIIDLPAGNLIKNYLPSF